MIDQRPYSLLRHAQELFGFSCAELAQVIGRSEIHVRCVIRGADGAGKPYPEYLDGRQRRAVLDYCKLARDRFVQGYDEISMMG